MDWPRLLNPNRRRQTTIPTDPRSQFERDFDRSVFSTPVKRLQDKAQVFPLEPHDAVRTRLTHSLEVSSVARGLAARSAKWLLDNKKISPGMDRSIEAIAATCGLIHDLGNPPFGHAGEDAIRAWFQRPERTNLLASLNDQQTQDFLKFEGNAQSLRLVAKLQILTDDSGLNLTFGTLSALMKYVASSEQATKEPDRAFQKPGYFASETDVVKEIRRATGTAEARNPICFLVEAADDISYLAADVEDAVKKGVLPWDDIEEQLQAAKADCSVKEALDYRNTILGADQPSVSRDLEDDIKASAFRTAAIKVMLDGAFRVFKHQYEEIIEGRYPGSLLKESDAKALADLLRKIGTERVYSTPSTLTLELMGRHVIGDLMDVFWEGAAEMPLTHPPSTSDFAGKAGALFSRNYAEVFRRSVGERRLPIPYHRLQLVTDHICGMTDSFAKRLHADLFNGR